MLKCSRCQRIFPAPTAKKPPSPPRLGVAKPSARDDGSLTLPFDEPAWKDETEAPAAAQFDVSEPEEDFVLGTDEGRSATPPPTDASRKAPTRAATADAQPALPPEPRGADDEDEEVDEDEVNEHEHELDVSEAEPPAPRRKRPRRPPQPPQRSNLGAFFIFLGLVVAGYGMLTRALFASPALCDRLIGRLPVIGTLGDERLLTRKVALSDMVGSYQRIRDGKDVFVITGKAMNTAPVALHSVQIAGRLFNNAGKPLDEKTIYCGNVISAKVLKDLTPTELSILQKLSPPKKFVIEPGESSTFVVVFMDPPREAVEFTARVVVAQRQA